MRAMLFSVLLATGLSTAAQTRCAFMQYHEVLRSREQPPQPTEKVASQTTLSATAVADGAASLLSDAVIRIPVVVHILYNTAAQNIPEAEVMSGIAALNRDFRRKNGDTTLTPERFRLRAADTEIEFELATVDPRGRATNGIERRQTAVTDWKMDDKIKMTSQGGLDAWDANSYLNIWIGPMRNLLGFASTPGGPVEWDGIVINTTSFGTGSTSTPYNMGRTAVHEAGHWLGLKHIWGDTYCGDDGVGDTPPQGNFTSGCPQSFRSSCSNGTDGDMYMNFMDFTNDACMNLFTEGQRQRMRALFYHNAPRSGLLASRGLSVPWSAELPLPEVHAATHPTRLNVYPNPSRSFVVVDLSSDPAWLGCKLVILNADGRSVKSIPMSTQTVTIDINGLSAGVYILQARKGQNVISKKLVVL